MAEPAGEAVRFSGDGKLRICSTVNGPGAACGAARAVSAAADSNNAIPTLMQIFIGVDVRPPETLVVAGKSKVCERNIRRQEAIFYIS